MDSDLQGRLDRAQELLRDLEREYGASLASKTVSERAKNLTHEVLEKVRHALDAGMHRLWELHIAPKLTPEQRKRARIYFPIANDLPSFQSILGRAEMEDLATDYKVLYDLLLAHQPFTSADNRWLAILRDLSGEGKHIRLRPQKRTEGRRIVVEGPGGAAVSWDPSAVRFGGGVSVMGAPIDPNTQRIVPTPGITEREEIWVAFLIEWLDINALGFCQEAHRKTGTLLEEMLRLVP